MVVEKIRETEMVPRLAEIGRLQEIEVGGETNIDDAVIGAIAGMAAREVEGVSSLGTNSIRRAFAERMGGADKRLRGVVVEAGRREAVLDVDLRVVYGFSIPLVVVTVRRAIVRRLLDLWGLVTKEININVVGVEFPERMPSRVE